MGHVRQVDATWQVMESVTWPRVECLSMCLTRRVRESAATFRSRLRVVNGVTDGR